MSTKTCQLCGSKEEIERLLINFPSNDGEEVQQIDMGNLCPKCRKIMTIPIHLATAAPHSEREIAHDETEDLVVDTVAVNDSEQPFETGIKHPLYNDGRWIIVEMYNTKEEAVIGHNKWVEKMTAAELPDQLEEKGTSGAIDLLRNDGHNLIYKKGK